MCMIFQLIIVFDFSIDVGAIQDIHGYLMNKNNIKCLDLLRTCLLNY